MSTEVTYLEVRLLDSQLTFGLTLSIWLTVVSTIYGSYGRWGENQHANNTAKILTTSSSAIAERRRCRVG